MKMVHMAISREYYRSFSLGKVAKENKLVSGVSIVVWGTNGGPQGPR